jgi:integrase
MRHIKQIEDCKSVLIYEGSTEEYTTFLTPETSKFLDDYFLKRESDGEKLTPNSYVFRTTYKLGYAKPKPVSIGSLKAIIRLLINKSGLRINQVKIGSRFNKQADHAFRKRFNTILKTTETMNISLAEKMMGHLVTVQLDNVYLDPMIQQLFTQYKKAIPELTVDGVIRK